MLERADARAQEQMALIADLLEFGRLRDGQKRGRVTNVRLDTVLRQSEEAFRSQASQKGVALTVDIPAARRRCAA